MKKLIVPLLVITVIFAKWQGGCTNINVIPKVNISGMTIPLVVVFAAVFVIVITTNRKNGRVVKIQEFETSQTKEEIEKRNKSALEYHGDTVVPSESGNSTRRYIFSIFTKSEIEK